LVDVLDRPQPGPARDLRFQRDTATTTELRGVRPNRARSLAKNPIVFGSWRRGHLLVFFLLGLSGCGAGSPSLRFSRGCQRQAHGSVNWIPVNRPVAVNRRQGDPFWKVLGEAGRRVR
jgi:hypothetical protein